MTTHDTNQLDAFGILNAAAGHMKDRAATYDKPQGERSMGRAVAAFEAITGVKMTAAQGWLFMVCLKAVRSQQGDFRSDNYEDGAAYFALYGEEAAGDANGAVRIPATDDGWIEWKGGVCPVEPAASVQVRYRDSEVDTNLAGFYRWSHGPTNSDIIAYRFVGG